MLVTRFYRTCLLVCAAAAMCLCVGGDASAVDRIKLPTGEKKVIGPTEVVEEAESDFEFPARVDTGATTSSIHVEECKVEGAADQMDKNVGKTIHFKIKSPDGESEWLERKIAEISTIKTSEREEVRYKVPITLNCKNVKKKVLVSLNDRSHMQYPLLLGRNFLQGDFVVDVDMATVDLATSETKASELPGDAKPKESTTENEPATKPTSTKSATKAADAESASTSADSTEPDASSVSDDQG